ncbi:helix-turn-helix transcriptional regulator [Actinocrispum sp. NPDC049592]|uniref:helix-turn-helix domain-containing protein n=1 Tax=Actinocrispum sp. NPDC049592 TaxID=3154835 RepID=UPI00341C741E
MDFASALRARRTRRRMSQLELAVRAGTTQRHVSFMESGRSAPGRAMVVRLAESLELPLRERNELLLTAGFAPAYPQTSLDDTRLAPVMTALTHILNGHMPFPAIVVDRYGDIIAHNAAFPVLIGAVAPQLLDKPMNAYRIALHPKGMAPRIGNFAAWARHVTERLHQESVRNPDPRLTELATELDAYLPDIALPDDHLGFAVPLELGDLRLTTTVTTFATAVDITIAELKLEAFLPADAKTAEALRSFAWPSPTT